MTTDDEPLFKTLKCMDESEAASKTFSQFVPNNADKSIIGGGGEGEALTKDEIRTQVAAQRAVINKRSRYSKTGKLLIATNILFSLYFGSLIGVAVLVYTLYS